MYFMSSPPAAGPAHSMEPSSSSSSKPMPASSRLSLTVPWAISCHRLLGKARGIGNCDLPAARSVSFPASMCCTGRATRGRLPTLTFPCSFLTVHTASEPVVRGVIGRPVQLPCSYPVARHKDISDMCWGRGPCPNSKCNDKILHTTGNRVTYRKSQRYNLRGYISYGDVSLTIAKVKAEDAGTYCCRIEIPGWFNDIKRNMRLEVVRGEFGDLHDTAVREKPLTGQEFKVGVCVLFFFSLFVLAKSVFPKSCSFQGRSATSFQFESHSMNRFDDKIVTFTLLLPFKWNI